MTKVIQCKQTANSTGGMQITQLPLTLAHNIDHFWTRTSNSCTNLFTRCHAHL